MNTKRLDFYPVIGVRGEVEKIPYVPRKDIPGEDLMRTLGMVDNVMLLRNHEITLGAFVRDNGLFDGSEPNMVLVSAGFPICGPVLLHGGASHASGNLLPPPEHEYVQVLLDAAGVMADTIKMIQAHRENPFTIEIIDIPTLAAKLEAMNDE